METEKSKKKSISLPSAIVVAGIIISLSIVFSSSGGKSSKKDNLIVQNDSSIPAVIDADFIMGSPNAEITIVEYSDFSCSFCARYHPTMKKIVEDYAGKVRWVYRHLPIFNKSAAVASQCVGNILGDENFFLYADKLFENQRNINSDFLKQEAINLGVSDIEYNECINDKSINDKITKDFTTVRVLAGINATPHTVLIDRNGRNYPFSGALPYEEVSTLIESLLDNSLK